MPHELKQGDRVAWSFRGRRVTGTVRKVVTSRTVVNGQIVAASENDPRYLVRSEKSGKETTRSRAALRRLRRQDA
jgi:hypothetical protein